MDTKKAHSLVKPMSGEITASSEEWQIPTAVGIDFSTVNANIIASSRITPYTAACLSIMKKIA